MPQSLNCYDASELSPEILEEIAEGYGEIERNVTRFVVVFDTERQAERWNGWPVTDKDSLVKVGRFVLVQKYR